MRRVILIGLWLSSATLAAADDTVRYTLTPVMTKGKLEVAAITMRFKGDADGETVLQLPDSWGGKSKLYEGLKDLKVSGDGVSVAETGPAVRTIKHAPGADLTVRYRVVQNWPGEPEASGANEYRPIIQPNYFHLIGNAIFAEVVRGDGGETDSTPASFLLEGLPRGWTFASDLEHGAMGRKLTVGDIIESVSVGGSDFRVVKREPLRVAIRGKWSFTDEAFVDRLSAIVVSHLRFWNDPDEPYLVTVLPLKARAGSSSLGGTGRSDAFAFFATDNAQDATLNRILAHEHLHTWIPRRIGSMPDGEAQEPADYWLSEGFTDFYTARLLVRDGIWTVDDFVRETNDLLRAYAMSKARTVPNSKIVSDFWTDPDVGKLPYQRGALLAMIWDARLRKVSAGARDFDDVMMAMKARASAGNAKPPLASTLFREEMKRAGVDPTDGLARFVEKGEAIDLPGDVFAPCGSVAMVEMAEFDRGFDPEKTAANGNKITGLRIDSPAYRAGLRDGMQIVKREAGKPGDSRVDLIYRVLDNGVERVITYKPEGTKRITLQEFALKAGLGESERTACVARLGGAS